MCGCHDGMLCATHARELRAALRACAATIRDLLPAAGARLREIYDTDYANKRAEAANRAYAVAIELLDPARAKVGA